MKKINKIINLMEMVYKSPNYRLNEDSSVDANVTPYTPIDIHPSFNGKTGVYYINVSFIVPRSEFANHKGFTDTMIGAMNRAREKNGKAPMDSAMVAKVQSTFPTNYHLIKAENDGDEDQCEITISAKIDDPISLVNDDKSINQGSKDYKKLNNLMQWAKKHLYIPNDMVDKEAARGIRMLHYSVTNQITSEMKANLSDAAEKMFMRLVKEAGLNNTLSVFSSMKIYKDNIVVDHQYSPDNVLSVMQQALEYDNDNGTNQFNTIKYLATPRQWAKLGREVINTDFPYYMLGSNTGSVSVAARKQYLSQIGKSTLSDLEESDSHQEKRASNIIAGRALNNSKFFKFNAYFDISATELINGANDRYETDYGYDNNLTGDWNNASKKRYTELHPQDQDQQMDDTQQKPQNDSQPEVDVDLIFNAVQQSIGGHSMLPSDASVREKMAFISQKIQDILKDEFVKLARVLSDKNYGPLIISATAIIMRMIGIPDEYCPNIGRKVNDNEAKAMYHPVVKIANKIIDAERKLSKVDKNNIDEMLSLYSSLIISEEVFNNELKHINENVKKEKLI